MTGMMRWRILSLTDMKDFFSKHSRGSVHERGINPQPIINGPLNDAEEAFSSFEDNISRVINSFQDNGKKQSSSDEGQVSSQLGKDLNRAAENNSIHEQGDRESDVTAMVAPQDARSVNDKPQVPSQV
jgi:hypothetical protein